MLLTEKVKQIFKPKDNKKVSSVVDPYKIQTDLTNDPDSKLGAFYYDTEIPTDITRYFKYDDRSTFEQLIDEQRRKILTYRALSAQSEVSRAISEIVNEIIFVYDDSLPLKLQMNEENEKLLNRISDEFTKLCNMSNIKFNLFEIVKKSFVDGQLVLHCQYGDNVKDGIQKIEMIDPINFYYNKEHDAYEYLMNEYDQTLYYYNIDEPLLQYSKEEIVRVDFGLHDERINLSYLEYALKPANMLKTLEDLLVPMRFSRSISRRVFNVDIGDLPDKRAREVMQNIQREFKYKKFYNNETGEVTNQQHITSMVEDYWFANRSGGRGTTVETLDETGNLGEIDDILYFARKLYRSLNIPISRLYLDQEADHTFDYETTSITHEEMAFFMFVSRLRKVYTKAFKELLKRQVVCQGIMTEAEWTTKENEIEIQFTNENSFIEKMKLDNFQKCMDIYSSMQEQQGKVISVKELMKKIFNYSDEEIQDILKEIKKEKEDPLLKDFYNQDEF